MPAIALKNVTVPYKNGKKEIYGLDGANLTIEDKKINVVLGASGSGKSTLLKLISGSLDYAGAIKFDGIELADIPIKNRNISLISQDFFLYSHLTVYDNIAFSLKSKKMDYREIDAKVKRIGKLIGIDFLFNVKPKQLSIGQQQKVALAKSLVKEPSLCLFDEPLSAIDAQAKESYLELIKKLGGTATIVYVTHNIKEAIYISDRIIVLDNGKCVIEGNKNDVLSSDDQLIMDMLKDIGAYEE